MLPFAKKALANLFKKPSTVRFPEVEVAAQPAYRGRLVYDPEKCVNCGMCIKVCSPGAITRTVEAAEGGENITYTIDLTSCTFCGTCQDFCSTKAMTLSEDYHMVAENAADLRVTGTRFKKTVLGKVTLKASDCVYCGLCARNCPENAITVDRAAKTWTLNEEECVKCGRCIEKCPKKALSFEEPKAEGVIMGSGCVFCTLCAKRCPVGAITVDRAAKTWEINRDLCIRCGLCVNNCPRKALSLGPVDENTPTTASAAKAAPAAPTLKVTPAPENPSAAPAPTAPLPEKAAPAPEKAAPASAAAAPVSQPAGLFPAASYDWDYGISLGPDCIYCGLCARKCPMEAITVDRTSKSWKIDREKCVWCGICAAGCPKKTLSLGELKAEEAGPAPVEETLPAAEEPAAEKSAPAGRTGVIFGEGCIYCGACQGACPVGAITVDGDSWSIDRDACIQCGACVGTCPMGVLSTGPID